jgi:hypothetical protein
MPMKSDRMRWLITGRVRMSKPRRISKAARASASATQVSSNGFLNSLVV